MSSEQIQENAAQPQSVTVDGTTVTQHPLSEQIAADRYARSKTATRGKRRGLWFSKLQPPGTT